MDIIHIVVLSLIQGLTEFLPVSSSGHLLLPSGILGWPDQGLAFDIAVHMGTLLAVVYYFRQDVFAISRGWLISLYRREQTVNSQLGWYIIIAAIPAGLSGLFLNELIESHLRTTTIIALTTIVFGVLLGWADYIAKTSANYNISQLTINIVLIIGFAQILALVPGTSRSGITITAALFCGVNRESAARFSFLIAIPIILLSGCYKAMALLASSFNHWGDIFIGFIISTVSAFICIMYFMKFIHRIGMMPFVIYRLVLGVGLLICCFY